MLFYLLYSSMYLRRCRHITCMTQVRMVGFGSVVHLNFLLGGGGECGERLSRGPIRKNKGKGGGGWSGETF